MIEEVKMWKTSDGTCFPTKESAKTYDDNELIIDKVSDFIESERLDNGSYTPREIAVMLCAWFKMESR